MCAPSVADHRTQSLRKRVLTVFALLIALLAAALVLQALIRSG
jgi:hypothetical protein